MRFIAWGLLGRVQRKLLMALFLEDTNEQRERGADKNKAIKVSFVFEHRSTTLFVEKQVLMSL